LLDILTFRIYIYELTNTIILHLTNTILMHVNYQQEAWWGYIHHKWKRLL